MKNKILKARLKLLNRIMDNLDESVTAEDLKIYAEVLEKMSFGADQVFDLIMDLTRTTGEQNDARRNEYAVFGLA